MEQYEPMCQNIFHFFTFLGWSNEHTSLFDPPLPREKVEVIEKLGFGVTDKVFLKFAEVFWDSENPGLQLIDLDGEMEGNWVDGLTGFDEVEGHEGVLCGWLCGSAALEMEATALDEVQRAILAKLRKFVGPDVPDPLEMKVTKWGRDPLCRGKKKKHFCWLLLLF